MEADGFLYCWASRQWNLMPEIKTMVGFMNEMLFQYGNEDGTSYIYWHNGEVVSMVNAKLNDVLIK